MSLSVIPLTILGQITGVSGSGDTVLYQVSFKSIDGTPLYGVTAVWTDEQAEIEALAAQKPYGVWINPINGTFTVKFAGYTYVGSADLTDPDVLAGVTPIKFATTEVGDKLLPDVSAADENKGMFVENGEWTLKDVPYTATTTFKEAVEKATEAIYLPFPDEYVSILETALTTKMSAVIAAGGKPCPIYDIKWERKSATDKDAFDNFYNGIGFITKHREKNAIIGNQYTVFNKIDGDEYNIECSISYSVPFYRVSTWAFSITYIFTTQVDGLDKYISCNVIAAYLIDPSN